MRLLVFNAGSSSLKFDLLEVPPGGAGRSLKAGAFVAGSDRAGGFALETAAPAPVLPSPIRTLAAAADFVLAWLSDEAAHGGNLLAGVAATVHRVVHGGATFCATARLGPAELTSLAELDERAP